MNFIIHHHRYVVRSYLAFALGFASLASACMAETESDVGFDDPFAAAPVPLDPQALPNIKPSKKCVPELVPLGPTDLVIYSNTVLALRVSAIPCPASPKIYFSWTSNPKSALPPGGSTSSVLVVPPGTLDPGTSATFTVTATAPSGSDSVVFNVDVQRRPLVASIWGGPGVQISTDTHYDLNGSGSYDPDFPDAVPPAGATYVWSCLNAVGDPCGVTFPEEAVAPFPADILGTGEYRVTLTFGMPDGRAAEAQQLIRVFPPGP